MIAIDTNVVVRYLTGDNPAQAQAARKLIEADEIFVATTVLLEADWVLRSVHGFSAAAVAQALRAFAGLPQVSVEDADLASLALDWVGKGLDFADARIWREAAIAPPSQPSTAPLPDAPAP